MRFFNEVWTVQGTAPGPGLSSPLSQDFRALTRTVQGFPFAEPEDSPGGYWSSIDNVTWESADYIVISST